MIEAVPLKVKDVKHGIAKKHGATWNPYTRVWYIWVNTMSPSSTHLSLLQWFGPLDTWIYYLSRRSRHRRFLGIPVQTLHDVEYVSEVSFKRYCSSCSQLSPCFLHTCQVEKVRTNSRCSRKIPVATIYRKIWDFGIDILTTHMSRRYFGTPSKFVISKLKRCLQRVRYRLDVFGDKIWLHHMLITRQRPYFLGVRVHYRSGIQCIYTNEIPRHSPTFTWAWNAIAATVWFSESMDVHVILLKLVKLWYELTSTPPSINIQRKMYGWLSRARSTIRKRNDLCAIRDLNMTVRDLNMTIQNMNTCSRMYKYLYTRGGLRRGRIALEWSTLPQRSTHAVLSVRSDVRWICICGNSSTTTIERYYDACRGSCGAWGWSCGNCSASRLENIQTCTSCKQRADFTPREV